MTAADANEDMPKTMLGVLNDIVAAHGGRGNFTTAQMLVARGLTRCLAEVSAGDTSKAAVIPALEAMLPPRSASLAPIDLSRLSDRELAALERLVEIGNGTKPRSEHRAKSTRHWLSVELARKLDAAAVRPGGPNEIDKLEARSLMTSLLQPLWRGEDFWPPYLGDGSSPRPVVEETAPQPPAESPRAVPAAVADNVVPIGPFAGLELASRVGAGPSHPAIFDASDPSGRRSGKP